MDVETLREYCLSKPCVFECMPFGDDHLVFKVGAGDGKQAKMFALLPLDDTGHIALKCDPDEAIRLRDLYTEVTPAWHFNKRHWNDVALDGVLSDDEIMRMVDGSYDLVVRSLPAAVRAVVLGRQGGIHDVF